MYGDNELKQDPLLNEYSSQVEREISSVCEELLDLLKDKLVENCANDEDGNEAKVFYLKMAGDYYRYLAECIESSDNKTNGVFVLQRVFACRLMTHFVLRAFFSLFIYQPLISTSVPSSSPRTRPTDSSPLTLSAWDLPSTTLFASMKFSKTERRPAV